MKIIDITFDGREYTFRTNNNGHYLFTGVSENQQLDCTTGYTDTAKMKRAIRKYIVDKYGYLYIDRPFPRIKYNRIRTSL